MRYSGRILGRCTESHVEYFVVVIVIDAHHLGAGLLMSQYVAGGFDIGQILF